MANIKDIIAPVELITEDAALEKHLYECIITGDFATLETEKSAVIDAMSALGEHRYKLGDTHERMRRANEILPTIYSDEDFDYIVGQIDNVLYNYSYYKNRLDVINEILTNK